MTVRTAAEEKPIWEGGPSQVLNLGWFVLSLLIIFIPVALWKWLVVRSTRYELTSERLRLRHGVLNRKVEQLELYRVRDYHVDQPFWMRPFGLSSVVLNTADQTHPVVRLHAIAGGEALMEQLRTSVEACRLKKGVRDLEVN